MKKISTNLVIILLVMFSASTYAQFTVDGQFRTRFQALHGYKIAAKAETDATFAFDQRSRIIMNYKSEKYSTRLTLQDARLWGGDNMGNKTGGYGNSYSLGIYEAWVDLRIKGNSSLRIGRQEWNYDDMRILCWRNWWTSGFSYDGLLYKMHNKASGLFIDLGISYNNQGTPNGLVNNTMWGTDIITGDDLSYYTIKSMNFLNVKKKIGKKTTASLMLTLSAKEDGVGGPMLGMGTHGINLKHNKGKKGITDGIFGNLSAYYQHGTDMKRGTDGEYKKISSYLVAAELGYRTMKKKLEVSVGTELLSGHDYSNTDPDYNNTRHSFDLQYSARLPYYGGRMNHMVIQDSWKVGTKGGGYMSPYLKLAYKVSKKGAIDFGFFMPMLTTKVKAHTTIANGKPSGVELDENGETVYWKGNLGNYVDLGYTHKFSKEIIFKMGMSYGMPSDIKNQMVFGYKDAANKELHEMGQNYFGWAMVIVKPKFFNSEKK
jgi:hypothetical protein